MGDNSVYIIHLRENDLLTAAFAHIAREEYRNAAMLSKKEPLDLIAVICHNPINLEQ